MSGHGGARPGAGRKSKAEKFPEVFAAADERLAAGASDRLDTLEYLAAGGWEQVEQRFEPAGLIFVDMPLCDALGIPKIDANGRPIMIKQRAFPDLDPQERVCVEYKVSTAAPDRQSNIYLLDRLFGKPTQATELSGPGGAPVPVSVLDALDRVYGPDDDEAGEDGD